MFSTSYKRYALAVLTAVYTLNFVDRGLMMLLLEPIKQDLSLSDTQLGFLTGIAFGLFYATLGVPLARWADRSNRVTITALAIGLWGITVMTCWFVTNYVQLICARIAAAVGESGCKPPTYSLVGDYFPEPGARTGAMGIYLTGGPLSALVSFVVGGSLNELYGWRTTFFLVGIPGLVLAALVKLTLAEPRARRGYVSSSRQAAPSMKLVLSTLWQRQSFRHLSLGLILLYVMAMGMTPWYAAFMMRSHGMGTGELGLWLGLIISIGGLVGVLAGAYVSRRWFASNERGQMRMCALTVASLVPCFLAFLTLPGKYQALVALTPLIMVLYVFQGPTYTLMQRLVPDEMRATMMAVVMLLANLIGMGVGPQVVGLLSDIFRPVVGHDSLRYAMLTMSLVALWAAFHFWRAGRTVREDLVHMASRLAPLQRVAGLEASADRLISTESGGTGSA